MIAIINQTQTVITLPVPLGAPVYLIQYNQHDGWYVDLREYSTEMIWKEVFSTRSEAENAIKKEEAR